MDLGKTLKKLRKEKALSQEFFAEKCDITQTYLSQIENNVKEPTISTLRKICEVLEVPVPIIFFLALDAEDIKPEKREAFKLVSPSINSLVHAFFKV